MTGKYIRKLVRDALIDTYEEFSNPIHIIVLFENSERGNLKPLTEGKWIPTDEKDYWIRLDKPKNNIEQLHAHIAHKKHINTKNKQVAWNEDGTRHDKKSFNNKFNGLETAKKIAAKALDLPPNTLLENLNNKKTGALLLESIQDLPENSNVFIFQLVKKDENQILLS